ncbi:hypothetical protein CW304_28055 [Bacillus sp. UFRGS-B20]|nr:hypothetical protein CW304_28055 [Bacillus sp. UFRGS-B20]
METKANTNSFLVFNCIKNMPTIYALIKNYNFLIALIPYFKKSIKKAILKSSYAANKNGHSKKKMIQSSSTVL